jgi:hypothetical protein
MPIKGSGKVLTSVLKNRILTVDVFVISIQHTGIYCCELVFGVEHFVKPKCDLIGTLCLFVYQDIFVEYQALKRIPTVPLDWWIELGELDSEIEINR